MIMVKFINEEGLFMKIIFLKVYILENTKAVS